MSEEVISILSTLTTMEMINLERDWLNGKQPTVNLLLKSVGGRSLNVTVKVAHISHSGIEANIWQLRLYDQGINFGSEYLSGYYNSLKHTGHLRLGQL